MQKQKSQVRQYLSESFHQLPLDGILPSAQPHLKTIQQIQSAPGVPNDYSNGTFGQQLLGHSHSIHTGSSISPGDQPVLSPAISSGATSPSEVSCYI